MDNIIHLIGVEPILIDLENQCFSIQLKMGFKTLTNVPINGVFCNDSRMSLGMSVTWTVVFEQCFHSILVYGKPSKNVSGYSESVRPFLRSRSPFSIVIIAFAIMHKLFLLSALLGFFIAMQSNFLSTR